MHTAGGSVDGGWFPVFSERAGLLTHASQGQRGPHPRPDVQELLGQVEIFSLSHLPHSFSIPSVHPSIKLPVHPFIHESVCSSAISLTIHPSSTHLPYIIYLLTHPHNYTVIHLSTCLSTHHPSTYLPAYPSAHLSSLHLPRCSSIIQLSAHPHIPPLIHLSVHPAIHPAVQHLWREPVPDSGAAQPKQTHSMPRRAQSASGRVRT